MVELLTKGIARNQQDLDDLFAEIARLQHQAKVQESALDLVALIKSWYAKQSTAKRVTAKAKTNVKA